jgi:hypothetical protein
MTLAIGWPNEPGENPGRSPATGPMIMAKTWPHDPGENAGRWPHEPGDRQRAFHRLGHGRSRMHERKRYRDQRRRLLNSIGLLSDGLGLPTALVRQKVRSGGIFRTRDVCRQLGISAWTVRRLVKSNILPAGGDRGGRGDGAPDGRDHRPGVGRRGLPQPHPHGHAVRVARARGTTEGRTVANHPAHRAAGRGTQRRAAPRVFCLDGGEHWGRHNMRKGLARACRRAKLRPIGWHMLKHTFCSHLAMRGAVPKAIQELAGHTSLTVTLRYMHLAPSALRDAIRLLDDRSWQNRANEGEASEASRGESLT